MECPECFATIPDMAKFCPECGTRLTSLGTSGSTAKIEDSVVTRSPGAGSNYAPVINVSSNASSRDQKNARCPNCDMEISKDNRSLKCMECGAKFCENCEGFYRHEVRQRGEKPLCYKCYTAIAGQTSKNVSAQQIKEETPDIVISQPVHCPFCGTTNLPDSLFCVNCGKQITAKTTAAHCQYCGATNMIDSLFCVSCGKQISPKKVQAPFTSPPQASIPQVAQPPASVSSPQVVVTSSTKTSGAWWLLPLFFTWVGGVIAWLVVREKDKPKAKRLLIFGIAMVFVWIIIYVIAYMASY